MAGGRSGPEFCSQCRNSIWSPGAFHDRIDSSVLIQRSLIRSIISRHRAGKTKFDGKYPVFWLGKSGAFPEWPLPDRSHFSNFRGGFRIKGRNQPLGIDDMNFFARDIKGIMDRRLQYIFELELLVCTRRG
jgi:hypothetical protein